MMQPARRTFIGIGVAALPLLLLPGCATGVGGYSLDEVVRRLLSLSSQRAFGRLLQPGGFYDDQLARIAPPESLDRSGNDILGAILRTNAVRRQLAIALNDVAVDGAARAAPIVSDAIRNLSFADAVAILRGGPTAATDLLRGQIGDRLVEVMFPDISRGLDSGLVEILSAAAAARTGVNYADLARNVAGQASSGIFAAIGREEAAIRANPRDTGDPALIALLAGG